MSGEYSSEGASIELEDKPHDECGVVIIYAPGRDVRWMAYESLGVLQHRGQESAGIAVANTHDIFTYNDLGLARDVFRGGSVLSGLPSEASAAIGHVRYGTCIIEGFNDLSPDKKKTHMRLAAQPMPGHSHDGQIQIAVGFNGDVANYQDYIRAEPQLLFGAVSDADIIKRLILREINAGASPSVAVETVGNALTGNAFSLAVLFNDKRQNKNGIIALRDPNGFRPFTLGSVGEDEGWIVASESAAIRMNGARVEREVEPGEMIVIDEDGFRSGIVFPESSINPTFCAMDEIYLMRPDSEVNGQGVENMRFRSGEILARRFPVNAEVVVGVPDSGMSAANGYAYASGLPIRQGLVKNRTATERSFISPNGNDITRNGRVDARQEVVFAKLVANPWVVEGKKVVIVDDSIVRGNTLTVLIKAIRQAGATEVHIRVGSPPIISECHYGIDISSKEELIAPGKTNRQIAEIIGANSVEYLHLPDLEQAIGAAATKRCFGCMTGNYPTTVRKPSPAAITIA